MKRRVLTPDNHQTEMSLGECCKSCDFFATDGNEWDACTKRAYKSKAHSTGIAHYTVMPVEWCYMYTKRPDFTVRGE